MKLFPLFADLTGRKVIVVGGGAVAARKAEALRCAGAHVVVGAPCLDARLARLAQAGSIVHIDGEFCDAWLDDAWLVVAATGQAAVNRRVVAAATARRIFVNVVDDIELSSFHVPATVDRSPLIIAISSGGAAPMLARWLRGRLETTLEHALAPLAALLQRRRATIRERFADLRSRRRFYSRILEGGNIQRLLARRRETDAEAELVAALASAEPAIRGTVALVGAGPGDPGLLTLRGLRLLNDADVVLYDRLVHSDVLALGRRDALRIDVGKQVGQAHINQDQIHELMLRHARAGQRVVRLKGGDPFVFGRGGEELEFLRAHGIDYEVVPGITAALACAAYAGVPLTHRDHAQSVRLVTAHCARSLDALDWRALAADRQTLAVYMGVAELKVLRTRLIAHGRDADTPFALIENGSSCGQRVIAGPLNELDALARQHGVRSPALLIVGEVAALAQKLAWFGAAPIVSQALARAA